MLSCIGTSAGNGEYNEDRGRQVVAHAVLGSGIVVVPVIYAACCWLILMLPTGEYDTFVVMLGNVAEGHFTRPTRSEEDKRLQDIRS